MPRNIGTECFLEAVGHYLDARENGDEEGMARAAAEAEGRLVEAVAACAGPVATGLTAEQLGRIRRTIGPTVEDWLRDYGIPADESHGQLVNRVVAAVAALHQGGVLVVRGVSIYPR